MSNVNEPNDIQGAVEQAPLVDALAAKVMAQEETKNEAPLEEQNEPGPKREEVPPATEEPKTEEPVNETETEEESEFVEVENSELLAHFGIEDGIIDYGDEGKVKYDDLPVNEQVNVLTQLLANNINNTPSTDDVAANAAEEYSLNDDEIELVNAIRQTGKSLQEIIYENANVIAQNQLSQSVGSEDSFNDYSLDEIYKYDYLIKLDKEDADAISDEELELELEKAKESSTFEKRMTKLKDQYVNIEKEELANKEAQAQQDAALARENTAREFGNKTHEINEIGVFELDDDVKESIYQKFLTVGEDGKTAFEREILSDPVKAFKAVYHSYFADSNQQEMMDFFQKQLVLAKKAGKDEALGKMPEKPKTNTYAPNMQRAAPEKKVVKSAAERKMDEVSALPDVSSLHQKVLNKGK